MTKEFIEPKWRTAAQENAQTIYTKMMFQKDLYIHVLENNLEQVKHVPT